MYYVRNAQEQSHNIPRSLSKVYGKRVENWASFQMDFYKLKQNSQQQCHNGQTYFWIYPNLRATEQKFPFVEVNKL